MDIPGPTTQPVLEPTTTWALGTTQLVLHGARRCGAQGNQMTSARIGKLDISEPM
jgi:hypothetical protein